MEKEEKSKTEASSRYQNVGGVFFFFLFFSFLIQSYSCLGCPNGYI